MLNDTIQLTGLLNITLVNEAGVVIEDRTIDNLVVTTGKNYVASRMKDATATAMTHMAIGTGATAAAAGNTALETESGRVALASTNVSNNVVTYTATFAAGTGTGSLREAGILNANSGGTLLCRTVYDTITKSAGDSLTISWAVTVG